MRLRRAVLFGTTILVIDPRPLIVFALLHSARIAAPQLFDPDAAQASVEVVIAAIRAEEAAERDDPAVLE